MSRSSSQFRQADLTRMVRALRACGLSIVQTEISSDGRILVTHTPDAPSARISELDAWRARRDARTAQT